MVAPGPAASPGPTRRTETLADLLRATNVGAEIREVSCFHDGCTAETLFRDRQAFEEANYKISDSDLFLAVPAGATKSKGTASLKLNRDPLGSPVPE